ncbi:AAA family ATPase [Psychrobacillus sp. PGGUH221]|uniref:AAA family ATPase n=1 Tax=Psychrobacillus sp. PGGUH221 TaxID=3020058 RepID=UPI0035C75AB7
MKRILSIQGGMAGGKTTLTKKLEEQIDGLYFTYENPYPIVEKRENKNLDIYTKDGFVENQRLFIESEINRFNNLPDGKVIFDRGPEDIEFYTLHFPIANGFNWDIEQLLKDELQELRRCRSDIIIYLDASEETLYKRKHSDLGKRRNAFQKNIKLYKFEKDWFMQFNTKFLDVNNKTSEQVVEWTLEFLKKNNFL